MSDAEACFRAVVAVWRARRPRSVMNPVPVDDVSRALQWRDRARLDAAFRALEGAGLVRVEARSVLLSVRGYGEAARLRLHVATP